MPYHKPIPGDDKRDSFSSGMQSGLKSVVQVEKIAQIAFILPCAVCIGWLGGAWLDSHFHQSWITLTGFMLGCIAGISSAIKLAMSMVNHPKGRTAKIDTPRDKDFGSQQ
jgi:F0F1-type ATP synthase assembly protein I